MNDLTASEEAILDRHEPEWIAQGYKVVRHPPRASLPAFLEDYQPDAVLLGRSPQVLVEVVHKGRPSAAGGLRDLVTRLKGRDDWRLQVIYAGDAPEPRGLATLESLEETLATVRELASVEPRSALLLAWAALEAVARRLEPERSRTSQSPARLVELLASAGHVLPSEADYLRQAAQLRNRLAHGELDVRPSVSEIRRLASAAEGLVDVMRAKAS